MKLENETRRTGYVGFLQQFLQQLYFTFLSHFSTQGIKMKSSSSTWKNSYLIKTWKNFPSSKMFPHVI